MTDTTEELRVSARSIALAGIKGWGNLCNDAARGAQGESNGRFSR